MYWVGISNHAQEALGDVMFVQLPELRAEVIQGQACASIESLKAASDIHAPISGTIVEVNQIAIDAPETINAKPYEVWLFKIKCKCEIARKSFLINAKVRVKYFLGVTLTPFLTTRKIAARQE